MKVIIDRFEGDFAVCEKEDLTMITIEKAKIPKEAEEGYVLIIEDDKIIIDDKETEEMKKRIREMMDELF